MGMRAEDPTIAELLNPLGLCQRPVRENHLGDRMKCCRTMHGFDEFFGNLYHLNAEEEPELRDYPPEKDYPNFGKNTDRAACCIAGPTPTARRKSKIRPVDQEAHGNH